VFLLRAAAWAAWVEGCAQPGVAVAGLAGAASVAGLVGARADRGPGDEVLAASEDAHVEAALGDQHLRGARLDAGDGAEQLDELGVGGGRRLGAGVEGGDCVVEGVDVGEQTGDEDAVVGGVEAAGERLLEVRDLRPQPALGELGEGGRVAQPAEQRLRIVGAETE
jgi:hypothetical protein